MIKKLISHTFLYSVGPQIPRVVNLFLLPIITRFLQPKDYAVYGIVTSYLFFISAFKDLGFGVVFVNTFYNHPRKWKLLWRIFYGHLTLWSILFAILSILLLWIAIPKENLESITLIAFLIVVPIILFDNSNSISNYYLRFSEKPLLVSLSLVVSGCISVVVTYYSVVYLKLGFISWFLSSFISSAVLFLFSSYILFYRFKIYPIFRISTTILKPYLKVSLPMIPHNYSSYLLNSSDRVLLDLNKVDLTSVGKYNIAYVFGNYFEALGEAIGMAATPFYSKLYAKKNSESLYNARVLTYTLMTFFLLLTFTISLWMKEIFIILISNTDLRKSYDLGILIIMGYCYRPFYWSVGVHLSIFNKTNSLWKISFIGGLLNVILNLVFIPLYGVYASAVCTFVSLLFIGFFGFLLKDYQSLTKLNHKPLNWLFTIITLTIIAYLLKDVDIVFKGIISLAMFLASVFVFFKFYPKLQKINI